MKLTQEDIRKYGTKDEQIFLEDWRKKFDPNEMTQLKVTKLHFKDDKKKKKKNEDKKKEVKEQKSEDAIFKIIIRLDNAAFEEYPEIEISRILKKVINDLNNYGYQGTHRLLDINGNTVGTATLHP